MGKQALYLHGLLMSKGHMPYHLCDSRSAHGKDAGVGGGTGSGQWCPAVVLPADSQLPCSFAGDSGFLLKT
jgi:hypothetical protein